MRVVKLTLGGLKGWSVGKWMARKKTPPWNGESPGPIMVACQWKRSSPIGPAEHDEGGSRPRSVSSLLIRFNAIVLYLNVCEGVSRVVGGHAGLSAMGSGTGGR